MSYIYRPKSTKWTLAGKACPPGTPGAKKKVYVSSYWYGAFTDYQGNPQRVKLSERKDEAQRLLAGLIAQDDRRRLGQSDPVAEQVGRPLAEHIAEFRAYLLAKGNTEAHATKVIKCIEAVCQGDRDKKIQPIGKITEITENRVLIYLAHLRTPPELRPLPEKQKEFTVKETCLYTGLQPGSFTRVARRNEITGKGNGKARRFPRAAVVKLREEYGKGMSNAGVNNYLKSMKSFCNWLVRNHRLERDPLSALSRFNERLDVRHKRRALSPEEFAALLTATRANKPWRGISGPDRARLYLLAARSGFREQELASLCPGNFDLKNGFISLPADISKRRKAEKQPIARDILEAILPMFPGKSRDEPLWPGTWHHRGAEMLRVDLQAAGIPYQTEEGVFDFHATRHLFISDLIASGVNPKEAQILARHSTIELTLGRYSHVQTEKLREAVERLGK